MSDHDRALGLDPEADFAAYNRLRQEAARTEAAIEHHARVVAACEPDLDAAQVLLRELRAGRILGEATDEEVQEAEQEIAAIKKRAQDSRELSETLSDAAQTLRERALQEYAAAQERRKARVDAAIRQAVDAAVKATDKAAEAHLRVYNMERAAFALQIHAVRQESHLDALLPKHMDRSGHESRTNIDNWLDRHRADAAARGEGQ